MNRNTLIVLSDLTYKWITECLWIEIKFKNKKNLYGTFYIPPDSGSQSWLDIEQSINLII
jgi:hypothetical protein